MKIGAGVRGFPVLIGCASGANPQLIYMTYNSSLIITCKITITLPSMRGMFNIEENINQEI